MLDMTRKGTINRAFRDMSQEKAAGDHSGNFLSLWSRQKVQAEPKSS